MSPTGPSNGLFPAGNPRGTVLQRFCAWALLERAIEGVLLVGSCAAGTSRANSDDLIVITPAAEEYVQRTEWLHQFGEVLQQAVEDYGAVQSIRAFFAQRGEFEFGFALPSWATTEPIDPGTRRVIADGSLILIDRRERLARLRSEVRCTSTI